MKKIGKSILLLFVLMLLIPVIPLMNNNTNLQVSPPEYSTSEQITNSSTSDMTQSTADTKDDTSKASEDKTQSTKPSNDGETVTVFRNSLDKQETLDMKEYLIGVVMSEMPVSFEAEALKAQAVVAYTYTHYQLLRSSTLTDSSATHQAYSDVDTLKERFGDTFEESYQKVSDCVDAVYPQVLTYEDEPILAAFHAVSCGQTENAENVWGGQYPYLVSVGSEGDSLSDEYTKTTTLTKQEVKSILQDNLDGIKLGNDPANWFDIQTKTSAGYVDTVTVGDQTVSGVQLRSLFSLRSADFSINYQDDTFTFTTRGYGHGVGMSQYGANYYAKQGKTYEEILAHYYPDTKLVDAES